MDFCCFAECKIILLCTIFISIDEWYVSQNNPGHDHHSKENGERLKKVIENPNIDLRNRSSENVKIRVSNFIHQVTIKVIKKERENPFIEDDHYRTWRTLKQFRDIEDQDKFIGFKSFRHKPNSDVGKYFTERERKEIEELAHGSENLVSKQIIPFELLNRSLRSQGPLNQPHTFRSKAKFCEFEQPRMRYTNTTDQERKKELEVTYDDKFSKTYNGFRLNKSKIGSIRIFTNKEIQEERKATSVTSDKSVGRIERYFSVLNDDTNPENEKIPSILTFAENENDSKIYFKSAKTMAMTGNVKAMKFMIDSQYDRKKDLSNLKKNVANETFSKRPIL